MKTPEEIKNAMIICGKNDGCDGCPYCEEEDCFGEEPLLYDALAYINALEKGETSKDASIRECLEESGVSIKNAKYYGECGNYSYTFSGGHLKMPNDDFFHTFKVNSITKNIYVHVYEIDEFQDFTLEKIFINGYWVDISEAINIITHNNTKEIFLKALDLFRK